VKIAEELERLALGVQFMRSGPEFIEERLAIVAKLRELANRTDGRRELFRVSEMKKQRDGSRKVVRHWQETR
jgi:hypothetical protein